MPLASVARMSEAISGCRLTPATVALLPNEQARRLITFRRQRTQLRDLDMTST
jgi:hypothetical protein